MGGRLSAGGAVANASNWNLPGPSAAGRDMAAESRAETGDSLAERDVYLASRERQQQGSSGHNANSQTKNAGGPGKPGSRQLDLGDMDQRIGFAQPLIVPAAIPWLPILIVSIIVTGAIVAVIVLVTEESLRSGEAAMRIKLLENTARVTAQLVAALPDAASQQQFVAGLRLEQTELRHGIVMLVKNGSVLMARSTYHAMPATAEEGPVQVVGLTGLEDVLADLCAKGGGLRQLNALAKQSQLTTRIYGNTPVSYVYAAMVSPLQPAGGAPGSTDSSADPDKLAIVAVLPPE